MREYRLRVGLVTAAGLALAACGEDMPTQPTSPVVTATAPAAAAAADTWITRANMSNKTDFAAATITNAAGQSIVYAIGGFNPNRVPLAKVTAYNAATNTWSFPHPLPIPLAQSNGAGVINGKIYVSGGFQGNDDLSIGLYVYDPATNAWTRKQDLPILRDPHGGYSSLFGARGVTGVIGGQLYVVTGCFMQLNEPAVYATEACGPGFFRYNPVAERWTMLPPPALGDHAHSPYAGGVIGGKFYVMGADFYTHEGHFAVYDPATNTWTPKTSLALARPGAGTAVLGGGLYVMGGSRYNAAKDLMDTLDVTIVYDPSTDAWTRRASLPSPRKGVVGAKVVVNGQARIELMGGNAPGNNLQYIP